jgi:hypothetical protein
VDVAVHRHAFALLPPLHRADVALQVCRDVLPRVEPVSSEVVRWPRRNGRLLAHKILRPALVLPCGPRALARRVPRRPGIDFPLGVTLSTAEKRRVTDS